MGLVKAVQLNAEQEKKLQQLIDAIPEILGKISHSGYDEIFGFRINVDGEEYVEAGIRNEILLKFLIANNYDVATTKSKLVGTLNWRAEFDPLSAAYNEKFEPELDKLGVITVFGAERTANYHTATWNLYGNMKTPKKLFEAFGGENSTKPGTQFLRWRVGLMEKALSYVDFSDADNHKIVQIHDYKGVSMFKVDKGMKAATKEIISIFGDNYPELLSTKFFINVPSLMSWMFTLISSLGIISKETMNKFRPLNHGDLSQWFEKKNLPVEYGGEKGAVASLFAVDQSAAARPTAYARYLLDKENSQDIEDNILSVE